MHQNVRHEGRRGPRPGDPQRRHICGPAGGPTVGQRWLGRVVSVVVLGDRSGQRVWSNVVFVFDTWLQQQYYVMPFLETGDPITVKANGGAVPVVKLTKLGGNGITWSANSQYISWTVGQKIYRVSVDQLLKAQPDLPSELDKRIS